MKRTGFIWRVLRFFFVGPRELGVEIPGTITLYMPENRVIRIPIQMLLQNRNCTLHSVGVLKVGEIINALASVPQMEEPDPDSNGILLKGGDDLADEIIIREAKKAKERREAEDEEEDMSDAVRPEPSAPPERLVENADELSRLYGVGGKTGLLSQAQIARRIRAHKRS